MTFKVTVVNKLSENVLHKGRNGAGVKAELFFIRFDKMFGKHHVSDTKRGASEYESYFRKVIEFLKANEDIYRKAITSSDIRFFIEKLKAVISKKIFEESAVLPFSQNKAEKYAQIRFLTNACVDTMVDYFKGNIDLSLDEVGGVIIDFLNNMRK